MGNNIIVDIEKKLSIIKREIKELQDLLGSVSEKAKLDNNNKLIYLKRDVDKLKSASNYINNIEIKRDDLVSPVGTFKEDVETLHKDILSKVSKMEDLYKSQEIAEKRDQAYKGKFFSYNKNLDNLKLAHSNIRQMNISSSLSKKEWNEIK